ADPTACPPSSVDFGNTVCDHFFLNVAVDPSFWIGKTGGVTVTVIWADSSNDFDLFVYDVQGNEVTSSTQGGTTSEKAIIDKPSGKYEIVAVPFQVTNSGYTGSATFASAKSSGGTSKWKIQTHGACCEGNLAASGPTTYVLLPELTT